MKVTLIICLCLFFIGCEKPEISQCERDQTFTLVFKNYYGYIDSLHVRDNVYYVKNEIKELKYIVPIEYGKTIFCTKTNDTTKMYIKQVPNACATYNYFW